MTLWVMLSSMSGGSAKAQDLSSFPHLRTQGTATQLVVHNTPFLMLAGELGNSSASDLKYMEPVWPRLKAMRLNTVLMPVYWELIEPQEGTFEFTLVDSMLASARKSGLKLVVLWFGSWKNSMSCYVPAWVKTDQKRFPRARKDDGRPLELLTPFAGQNLAADAKAFSTFMNHLRASDGEQNTVVMVQVENEIGMIPQARDHCTEAEEAFGDQVPVGLISYLRKNTDSLAPELRLAWSKCGMKTSGTWEQVFGKGIQTDEIFMAWHFARYTDAVARAGKMEYPLPMYVNAALSAPNARPGDYPSGGPLPHLMDIWRAAAPHVDFLAPDIYFSTFPEWLARFDRGGNPVFIPEVDRHQSIANAFYAISQHNAMGYSPFSIESADENASRQIAQAYDVLHQLTPMVLERQGTEKMAGFLLDSAAQKSRIVLGDYVFNVRHEYTWPWASRSPNDTPRVGGLILMTARDEFLIAGSGVVITFQPAVDDQGVAGILSMEEGRFVGGQWTPGRRMNGDQDHQGRQMHLPGGVYGIQKVRLYSYR